VPVDEFDWFSYPRHREESDEASLSRDARALGFRIGATTAIKVGHLSEVATGWQTYIDWMHATGRVKLMERYAKLSTLVGEFLDEDPQLVNAKSLSGARLVADAWNAYNPQTPAQVRAFYGQQDNGYLYDLVRWNCQPMYERLISPLYDINGQHILVLGPGLGTEIEVALEQNCAVTAYEIPGILHEFLAWRFDEIPGYRLCLTPHLMGPELDLPPGPYEAVCAIDVLEHIHPTELGDTLNWIAQNLRPGGKLVCHVPERYEEIPAHFDTGGAIAVWLEQNFERIGESLWKRLSLTDV